MKKITVDNQIFDLKKTLECGQYFHWYEKDGEYMMVHRGQIFKGIQGEKESTLIVDGPWEEFLRIGSHENEIQEGEFPELQEIFAYGEGLTLLGQDPFLTIISFILSANNHFKRIQGAINALSEHYGNPLAEGIYAFPTPEQLSHVTAPMYREEIHTGYRDQYLEKTVQMILMGEFDLEKPLILSTDEARKYVMQLPGVGPKVADCILLFAYQKPDVFPVDVWMHRAMQSLYFERPATKKEVFEDAMMRFGTRAGYIQQLIFYYGKEHKIGR